MYDKLNNLLLKIIVKNKNSNYITQELNPSS